MPEENKKGTKKRSRSPDTDEKGFLLNVVKDVERDLLMEQYTVAETGVSDKKVIDKIKHLLTEVDGKYHLNVPQIRDWAHAVVTQHKILIDKFCSFSISKEAIHINIHDPEGGWLTPEAVKHVFIHEVCHCICPTRGHEREFWLLLSALPQYSERPAPGYICTDHASDSSLVRDGAASSSSSWVCSRGLCSKKNDPPIPPTRPPEPKPSVPPSRPLTRKKMKPAASAPPVHKKSRNR